MVTPMTHEDGGGGEHENRSGKKRSREGGGIGGPLWGYYTFIVRHGRVPDELFPGMSRESPSGPSSTLPAPENK